jgi:hypothetical protein
MEPMTPEEVNRIVETVRGLIKNYRAEHRPGPKLGILNNLTHYLPAKLGDKYNEFLIFAFPQFSNPPVAMLVCTDELPELLGRFLTLYAL